MENEKTPIVDIKIGIDQAPAVEFSSSFAAGGTKNIVVQGLGNDLLELSLNTSPNGEIPQDIFDQMISTFKLIGDKEMSGGVPDMFRTSIFSVIAQGYFEKKEIKLVGIDDGNGNTPIDQLPYFDIAKFREDHFKESIKEGVDEGNSVNLIENGVYKFNLGYLDKGKISCDDYVDNAPCVDDKTETAIMNSSPSNPVWLQFFFGIHDNSAGSLAYKIKVVDN